MNDRNAMNDGSAVNEGKAVNTDRLCLVNTPPETAEAAEATRVAALERGPDPFTMGPSLLFCPADRPERFVKAAERSDAVILDLEDAVSPEAKADARRNVVESDLDPETTIVRVNAASTEFFAADVELLRETEYRTVMLAKTESADQVRELAAAIPGVAILALCETAKGVLAAPSIAEVREVTALMWGAEDLVASLGGQSSRTADGTYRDVARAARSHVLLAAGAHGKAAIDAVYVNIKDTDGLAAEAEDAVASGFAATACIHPSQVDILRKAYSPTAEETDWARRVLEAAKTARGVFSFEDKMVDGPILRHAERTIARASRI